MLTTAFGVNPECRCDHAPLRIRPLRHDPAIRTPAQILRRGESLSVPGKTFVRALVCSGCGARRKVLRLESRLSTRQRTCARCGKVMLAPGFDQLDRLDAATPDLDAAWLHRPLASLGVAAGEVLRISSRKNDRYLAVHNQQENRHA